ncbi:uncharacterized protein DSM5745_02087 [Aspergillus mulundensis]|uniref:LCCL domain-containing protein n=1 Tax=Aspergillus mulundensis TaxID=1810919 RepID=A0A3D8SVG9_9EURO|nr:hypothetical protein DSM5745_02087 [Aspergillus mulundensis]RDW90312.1 hypothetical protein DSM5745_02087 [Aspergillus mulundensis]
MASPLNVTVRNLTGSWALNQTLSSSPSPALELQGVSWLVRSAIASAPVTITTEQSETLDEKVGNEITTIASTQSTLGRTVDDVKYLKRGPDGEGQWSDEEEIKDHPLFGSMSVRSRWARMRKSTLDEKFTIEGMNDEAEVGEGEEDDEATEEEVIEVIVHGTTGGWISHQIWAFEEIDGQRYHTRRARVTKDEKVVTVRMVYDWQGHGN